MIQNNPNIQGVESAEEKFSKFLESCEDTLFCAFSHAYMKSVPERALENYSDVELMKFMRERHSFFEESVKQKGDFRFFKPVLSEKIALELIYPDMLHLLMTLEMMLRNLGISIVFRLNPILGVVIKNQVLVNVLPQSEGQESYCCIYLELDRIDGIDLDNLKLTIQQHLNAVECVARDLKQIQSKTAMVKAEIESGDVQSEHPKQEWIDLIGWLERQHFHFLGYVEVQFEPNQKPSLDKESGLGLLASDHLQKDKTHLDQKLVADLWKGRDQEPFAFENLSAISPVQSAEKLICLRFQSSSRSHQHFVFVGLIRRSSLHASNLETPIIHLKLQKIFEQFRMIPSSYSYNQTIRLSSVIPKFELFWLPQQTLARMIEDLLLIYNPNEIRAFFYPFPERQSVCLLIVLPTDIFNRVNVEKTLNYLKSQIPHQDYELLTIRSVQTQWLHIYFDLNGKWRPDLDKILKDLNDALKSWESLTIDFIHQKFSTGLYERATKYLPWLPSHYRSRTSPEDAAEDIFYLEQLTSGEEFLFNMKPFVFTGSALSEQTTLLYIYCKGKINLTQVMPIIQNMGIYVLDQLNARIGTSDQTIGYVMTFRIQDMQRQTLDVNRYKVLFTDLLKAALLGRVENDPLNALCLLAEMSWEAIRVVVMYRNLYFQLKQPYSIDQINTALLAYPQHTLKIFQYFETKFSCETSFGTKDYRQSSLLPELEKEFIDSLRNVKEVVTDAIFRRLFELISATLRTNFYIPKTDANETFLSVKLCLRSLENIPSPVPYREIYVYDSTVEGVHLRFGAVARGGLRWSDRHNDFRSEVLNLVQTQQTKNVVIIPNGSKGGFIVKKKVSAAELPQEGQRQYQRFIRSLLDITDNLDFNRLPKHPNHVICYDDYDPYLVVAADKGTATFSDFGNAEAEHYEFWLGDAFASGGSVGYDHKKEGITARGAWECVKLHFAEMGRDIQNEPSTVIGVGDMSGDVFGNGMLLSQQILLVAAFNHKHIFLDPTPNAQESWQERQRLFHKPRSGWNDYQTQLISQGGGIFERNAKEVTLSPEVQKMLGVQVKTMTGEELICAILKMPADLLWFGGVGTYIKSDDQTHADVGDHANNLTRIDVSQCQVKVIGEGANLGMTQPARIQFAKQGGRGNTDAIDNSAGVNMSDYEVNIKVLLQQLLQQGKLESLEDRNATLREATDEVSNLVLANNRAQHRLLSMDEHRTKTEFRNFKNLTRYLVAKQNLDAESEKIPTRGELERMEERQESIPRPVLAILQAYVKMNICNELEHSKILDHDFLKTFYQNYFPQTLLNKFADSLPFHPLRREITCAIVVNQIVNQAGMTFFYYVQSVTQASAEQIASIYLFLDASFDMTQYRYTILQSETFVLDKYRALIHSENFLRQATISFLQHQQQFQFQEVSNYLKFWKQAKTELLKNIEDSIIKGWQDLGFDEQTAQTIAIFESITTLPDALYLHFEQEISFDLALQASYLIDHTFKLQWIETQLTSMKLRSDWEIAQQEILLQNLHLRKSDLTQYFIKEWKPKGLDNVDAEVVRAKALEDFGTPLHAYFSAIEQIQSNAIGNLTAFSVCINQLNLL